MGEGDAERYRARRFRRAPQRLVDRRERAIVAEALRGLLLQGALDAKSRVLDVPCGFGRMLTEIHRVLPRVVGVDLSPAQARIASAVAPALAGNLLAGLPFADGSFDLVVCVRLLHHLHHPDDRRAVLRELRRLSRGHVLTSYYGDVALWRIHRGVLQALGLKRPRVAVVRREELYEDARAAGLAAVAEWLVLRAIHAHRFLLLRRDA